MAKKRTKKEEKKESDLSELIKQVSGLSPQDRAEFFKAVGAVDLVRYLGAEVRIDDWQGTDRKWPRATFLFEDETEESIDIIKTVTENATSIGHPLILHAIRRWQYIVLYHSALSGGGYYKIPKVDFHLIARTHLENIGKALSQGARNRAIPKEFALYIRRSLGTDMDYIYLQMTWEMLALDEIKWKQFGEGTKKERTNPDKLRLIAKGLRIATANWINLQGSSVLRLQGSVARENLLGARFKYAKLEPEIKLRDPGGNIMPLSLGSLISYSPDISDFELWVKPPDGPLAWVKLSELMQQGTPKLKPENNLLKIGDLIEAANYKLPRHGPTNRERKLAAFMGLKEFGYYPSKNLKANDSPYRQLYEPRPVTLDTSLESLKKRKLDLIIEFLKTEKGEKFLKTRTSWNAFRSGFDAWRFGYTKHTLRKYRSEARKQTEMKDKIEGKSWLGLDGSFVPPPWLDGQFLLPDFINEYECKEIPDWFSLPTVPANKRK